MEPKGILEYYRRFIDNKMQDLFRENRSCEIYQTIIEAEKDNIEKYIREYENKGINVRRFCFSILQDVSLLDYLIIDYEKIPLENHLDYFREIIDSVLEEAY